MENALTVMVEGEIVVPPARTAVDMEESGPREPQVYNKATVGFYPYTC